MQSKQQKMKNFWFLKATVALAFLHIDPKWRSWVINQRTAKNHTCNCDNQIMHSNQEEIKKFWFLKATMHSHLYTLIQNEEVWLKIRMPQVVITLFMW